MSYIYLEEDDLTWAAQQGLINANEVPALWPALEKRAQGRGGLNLAQVSFYAGTLLIVGALTWFMSVAWESSDLLFFLALGYVALFGSVGAKVWYDGVQWGIPQVVGGLFVTIAVAVSPIVTFAAQRYFDEWPISHGIFIELTPVVTGMFALYFIPFPFLTAPISVGLFAMANIDLAREIWIDPSGLQIALLSFGFGLGMDVVGFGVDRQKLKQDFSFWLYLFGTFASFGGLTYLFFTDNYILGPYHFLYAVFSAVYIIAATFIDRQSLVVFGSLGEAFYLLWLTNDLFYDSWAYPFILTAVGLGIIFVGIQMQKYITNKVNAEAQQAAEDAAAAHPYQLLPTKEAQFVAAPYMPVPMQAPQPYFIMPSMMPAPVPAAAPKTVDV